jgi:hypothetical protein
MGNFWPSGLELSDTQSPRDILESAQEDWRTSSDGVMDLVLQYAQSKSGNTMIIVHAKNLINNRTATLFSIVHLPERPYPVTIQPKDEDLPDFLKKTYYVAELGNWPPRPKSLNEILGSQPDPIFGLDKKMRSVTNPWVSDTPSEFRKKLAEAFNLGIIKREILNLASHAVDDSNSTNEDSLEDSVEN